MFTQATAGNKMVVSDCLSGAHSDESKPEIPENELNVQHVHSLISNFPITDAKLEKLKTETENETVFFKL